MYNFILGFMIGGFVVLVLIASLENIKGTRNIYTIPASKSPPPRPPCRQPMSNKTTNELLVEALQVIKKMEGITNNMKPTPPPTRLIKDGAHVKGVIK